MEYATQMDAARKGIASGMSYAPEGLQRQALFSIALVLFLFIMMINAALNFFLKRGKAES